MGGGQPSSGEQPSDSPSQKQQRSGQRKEQTPEGPDQQGDRPDRSSQAEGTPRGNRDNPPPTPKSDAAAPPDDPTQQPLQVSQDREQWGNLPIHMQELFRAEGGDKVPARYRDWIESYYRRLNDR